MELCRGKVALWTTPRDRRPIASEANHYIGRVTLRTRFARARNARTVIAEKAKSRGPAQARQSLEQLREHCIAVREKPEVGGGAARGVRLVGRPWAVIFDRYRIDKAGARTVFRDRYDAIGDRRIGNIAPLARSRWSKGFFADKPVKPGSRHEAMPPIETHVMWVDHAGIPC